MLAACDKFVGQAPGLRRALSPPICGPLATPHEADRGPAAAQAAAPQILLAACRIAGQVFGLAAASQDANRRRAEGPPQATGLPHKAAWPQPDFTGWDFLATCEDFRLL
jgi:hypothetical protein